MARGDATSHDKQIYYTILFFIRMFLLGAKAEKASFLLNVLCFFLAARVTNSVMKSIYASNSFVRMENNKGTPNTNNYVQERFTQ